MQTKAILRWSQYFLLIIGCVALGYVGWAMLDARIYQTYQNRRFKQELKRVGSPVSEVRNLPNDTAGVSSRIRSDTTPARPESVATKVSDESLARLDIGAIGLSAMILEGVDAKTLQRAIGHIPGTSLPGQKGNIAIAGHRDTFFRALRNIHNGDAITLTTLNGVDRYRVDSIQVVDPKDTAVLDESDEAVLTLITCYPFYFVGSAPQRFIVRAHRIPG